MKLIPLTRGLFAQVDDADFEWLSKWKWQAHKGKKDTTFYAMRGSGIRMHRQIMDAKRGELIDHEDRNGLNNQRNNIRPATHSQNRANSTKRKNSNSKYIGVYLCKASNRQGKLYAYWRISISHNGKRYSGHFKSEENAAIAYNILAEKYFGEFANLNIN